MVRIFFGENAYNTIKLVSIFTGLKEDILQ
jgi:hypothetical protein